MNVREDHGIDERARAVYSDPEHRGTRRGAYPAMSRSYPPRPRARTRVAGLFAATLLASAATSARADDEAARLFEQGRALMLAGRFDEACPKLAESQQRDPRVGTLLNLAACHEKQGKVGSAWVEYQKVLTTAKVEGQPARAKLAEERIAALDPVVPWLTVVAEDVADDVEVQLDGSAVAPSALGKDMPLDPGSHVVTGARRGAPGTFAEQVDLARGERRTVRVRLASPAPPPATTTPERIVVEPTAPPAPAPASVAPAPPAKKRSGLVVEAGLFLGLVAIDSTKPELDTRLEAVKSDMDPRTPVEVQSCGGGFCDLRLPRIATASAGLNVFLGYAVSSRLDVGVRGVVGPNLTRVGGSFGAVGPSASLAASDTLRFGLWLAGGDASATDYADVTAPSGWLANTGGNAPRARTALNGGFGAGLEIGWTFARAGTGSLVATATPLYIAASNGSFFAVPVGVAYRFD